MDFEILPLDLASAAQTPCDGLLVLVPHAYKGGRSGLPKLVAEALESGDLETAAGKTLQLWQPAGVAARRVVLAGCADATPQALRQAVSAGVSLLRTLSVRHLVVAFAGAVDARGLRAAVLAASESSYVYTATKSKPEPRKLERVSLGLAQPDAELGAALAEAQAIAEGVEFAREWANRPANHATPDRLAKAAQEIAKGSKLIDCEVLGPKEVEKLGMGAFLAVAQGSHEPLRFIILNYRGGARREAPVALVGKGITFDSGGISIKPAAEMDEMKFDMSGAASVLGVFRALARLQPKINVVGLIPACENLPDGKAVKPGDVVTSMSGQTIEILNTDAEGRLVLCDALTYAKRFEPRAVIDIATLTGACMIALGSVRSGLFSNSDALAAALERAGESAQDLCWRMPLDDEYAEGLKTNFADVANVAGRAAGAVTAAKFLQRFVEGLEWAHLDIAGTAWKGGQAKGATGRPVGLLLSYLLSVAHHLTEAAPVAAASPQADSPQARGRRPRPAKG